MIGGTVEWGPKRETLFKDYIHNELFHALGDRAPLERKWQDLITEHRARVIGDGTSEVPFLGAADFTYPLAAMHADPVYADLMQTLHIPQDFWSVTSLRSDTVNSAKPLQEFLSIIERNYLKMRLVNQKAFLDLLVLGTTVYKDGIWHLAKTVRDYDDAGQVVKVSRVEFRPEVRHVPLNDFLLPAYAWRIDPDEVGGAPWVAERFELTEGQLRLRAQGSSPFLPNYNKKAVETVIGFLTNSRSNLVRDTQREEDEIRPYQDRKAELYEIHARFDTDGDDLDEDVVVVYHYDSGTILRATYNYYLHGKRPFSSGGYIPGPGFYSIGIVESDEWAQLALTRLLNDALNNITLANTRMFSGPAGAGINPDEPIFPGRWFLLNPNEQIQSIQAGEVYPSIFNMMSALLNWSESRTSVSDLRQGNISELPSRTPASTVMSLLQEGNKRFDMVLANIRADALAQIGQRTVQNLIQISKDDPRWISLALEVLGERDGQLVAEILSGPLTDIEDRLGIDVTATSSLVNKEAEKGSFTALAGMTAQLYPMLLQLGNGVAQATQNPAILQSTITAAYTGTVELLRRLLELYGIQNPEIYLPDVQTQSTVQGQPSASATPGAAGPAGPPAAAPMGGPQGPGPFAQGGDLLAALLGTR